jgi:hypothetical protein
VRPTIQELSQPPKGFLMNTPTLTDTRTAAAFRSVKRLVGAYVTISVLTLVAVVLMRNDAAAVNPAVWIRGSIVATTSLLMAAFVARAARGSARAFLRLRIVSAIMVVAIAVIIALPGTFPMWLKIEQGVCGLILIGVVAIVNGRHLRGQFAGR